MSSAKQHIENWLFRQSLVTLLAMTSSKNKSETLSQASLSALRDSLLAPWLEKVAVHGWRWSDAGAVCAQAGHQDAMASAIFPNGIVDVAGHFADWADRQMLAELEKIPLDALRTRDRIKTAVLTRLRVLGPHRRAMAPTLAFWSLPTRVMQGHQIVWRTADRIWSWAGDTSRDHNRYTKRGLLASVMVATTIVWIDDKTDNHTVTAAFLDRRIENVMELGKLTGTMRNVREVLKRYPRAAQ